MTANHGLTARVAFWIAVGWLVLLLTGVLTADWLPFVPDPREPNFTNSRASFSLSNPLGTDMLGRSVLSRVLYGGRSSLVVGGLAVVLGVLTGGTAGVFAGYVGGNLDRLVSLFSDSVLAFPPLVFLLALAAALGSSMPSIAIGLGLVSLPAFFRLARANAVALKHKEFVLASRALGARQRRTLRLEILPNVALPIASYALVLLAVLIVAEGSLSFLGLGIQPPAPSWGGMIASGRVELSTTPALTLVPAAVMSATVLALNIVGDQLLERLDVRRSL